MRWMVIETDRCKAAEAVGGGVGGEIEGQKKERKSEGDLFKFEH
jgi:hypothetical protein